MADSKGLGCLGFVVVALVIGGCSALFGGGDDDSGGGSRDRNSFVCKVRFTGDDNWRLVDLGGITN